MDTDTRIAAAVARAVAARLTGGTSTDQAQRWLVAPPISYGDSGEHQSFAGTVSIGTKGLALLLLELGRSACRWAQRLVFVNGHGGNLAALASATPRLRYEARDVAWWPCTVTGSDAHAGHTETSILLHLSPADVHIGQSRPGNRAPLADLLPSMQRGGVAAVSEVGVLGDPTTATAADGERFFAEMVDGCVRGIRDWAPAPDGMLQ